MTTATIAQNPLFRAEKDGDPLSSGLVYTYQSGTTTPLATYQDEAGTILNTNPVVLNADGEALIRLLEDQAYRIVVRDSMGTLVSTTDDVRSSVTSSVAAGYLKKAGDPQTVSSVVTFSSSPKGPTPSADDDLANKAFVLGAVAQGIQGSTKSLKIDYTGTGHAFTVTADAVTVRNAAEAYRTIRNVSLSINASSVGANGIDTGSLAVSTCYFVFVIWNETTVAGLVSASSTSPTLPTGYTYSARVGAFFSDSSNKWPQKGYQRGDVFQRAPTVGANLTTQIRVDPGTAVGNPGAGTLVSQSLASYIPPTARIARMTVAAVANTWRLSPFYTGGITATSILFGGAMAGFNGNVTCDVPLIDMNVWWANDSASCALYASGWVDN